PFLSEWIHLYPDFWDERPRRQIGTILHELTHLVGLTSDRVGYVDERSFTRCTSTPLVAPGTLLAGLSATFANTALAASDFRPIRPTYSVVARPRPSQLLFTADAFEGFLEDYYLDAVR